LVRIVHDYWQKHGTDYHRHLPHRSKSGPQETEDAIFRLSQEILYQGVCRMHN
jgi:hypothetical protein